MILDLLNGNINQQDLLNYYNVTITIVDLPKYVNGFVFNYLDFNNIYINKNLSYCKRKKTILHELAHIELNHLNQVNRELFAIHITEYEDCADRYLKELLLLKKT